MFLNLLCYILIDVFDVFGVMDLFDGCMSYDEPDFFDSFE